MLTYPIGLLAPKGGAIPTDGLIGEWLFSGNTNDTSGNGNHAQLGDGVTPSTYPTLTTDKKGNSNSAYAFNGTSQYMTLGDKYDLGTSDFAISVWVDVDDAASFRGICGKMKNGGISGRWGLFMITGVFRALIQDNTSTYITDATAVTGWSHLIVTYDRDGHMSIYVDNVFKSSVDISTSASANLNNGIDNFFGCLSDASNNPSQYFDGKIDNIRYYNRVLTSDERTALYNELA